jgi:Sulfotransferase family
VTWKETLNRGLKRATGYQLQRAGTPAARVATPRRPRAGEAGAGDRLVQAPVFVICTLRSGSTLLRVLLDSHSEIHAPHELHLRYVSVHFDQKWSERSMAELGLDAKGAEYLLWDRLLHRELTASGKSIVVDKTPNNVYIVDRLRECWPDARFIFLLRHPAAIARSRQSVRGEDADDDEKNADLIRRYCEALEQARQTYDGHTVRYEELTAEPERVMRGVCGFLGVAWEPGMLDYGRHDHGRYKVGLGDWADKIKTGQIQPPEPPPPPEEIPPALREMAERWGYLAAEVPLDRRA